jgi:3-oxoacyl-[acyl-carrier protein] reductase
MEGDRDMDLLVRDKAFIVAGGSRGLGFATARVLVDEGARVVVSGRDMERVREAVDELGADRAEGVAADNADPATADHLIGAAEGRFGRVDGALISVGGPPPGPVMATGDDAWRSSFESVFLGALRLARAVAEAAGGDGASIVFVLSTSVRSPIPGLAVSNGLRPGLAMVAKTLADELGPRAIRVNGILPGRIATERMAELDAGADEAARRAALAAIPLGRHGQPEEFGRMAALLLSPVASYVTGSLLTVDGGALRTL